MQNHRMAVLLQAVQPDIMQQQHVNKKIKTQHHSFVMSTHNDNNNTRDYVVNSRKLVPSTTAEQQHQQPLTTRTHEHVFCPIYLSENKVDQSLMADPEYLKTQVDLSHVSIICKHSPNDPSDDWSPRKYLWGYGFNSTLSNTKTTWLLKIPRKWLIYYYVKAITTFIDKSKNDEDKLRKLFGYLSSEYSNGDYLDMLRPYLYKRKYCNKKHHESAPTLPPGYEMEILKGVFQYVGIPWKQESTRQAVINVLQAHFTTKTK